jgi:hypothetical protein
MALEPLQKTPEPTAPSHEHHVTAPITAHSAPAVDAGRLFSGTTAPLVPVGVTVKDLDETPLSWANERVAPPTPFERFNCTAEGDAPERLASPSHSARKREPTEPVHHTPHHRPEHQLLPESELPDFSNDRRSKYWNAFKAVSADAQARHIEMGMHLENFRHAEGDPTLGQLNYKVKSLSVAQDLPTLTDKQHVPRDNGVTVGSLFDGDNNVRLDKHDQQAINGASGAIAKGKGEFDNRMLDAHTSDARLRENIDRTKEALLAIQEAASRVSAAASAIAAHRASGEADDLRAEIDELKGEASDAKEIVDIVLGVVTTAVYAATGEAGDAINQLGVVAGTLLGHVNDKRIAVAMGKLAKAEKLHRSATSTRLAADLQTARVGLLRANVALTINGDGLHAVLSERRKIYNNLAFAAANEIPCPERSQHKIAGMLAAIPLVEMVVAGARVLGSVTTPPSNALAERGLGMAAYHGMPVAAAFQRACGELNYTRTFARSVQGEWSERLHALLEIKTRIGGLRAG